MPLLKDVSTGKIRLTKETMELFRRNAAKNDVTVNSVSTLDEALKANLNALPLHLAEDMLEFFENGKSELTSCSSAQALEEQFDKD